MGRAWDRLKAWALWMVLWADTGITRSYQWFKRITPDYIEPWVRVGLVTYCVLLSLFVWDVLTKPHRYYSEGQMASMFASLPTEMCSSDVNALRAMLGEKGRETKRWKTFAKRLDGDNKNLIERVGLLKRTMVACKITPPPAVLEAAVVPTKVVKPKVYKKKKKKKIIKPTSPWLRQ